MLMYHCPESSCASCLALSAALLPVSGLAEQVMPTTAEALTPADAGPWKCASVQGPNKPESVTPKESTLLTVSKLSVPNPVPPTASGTCAPFNQARSWGIQPLPWQASRRGGQGTIRSRV